MGELHLDLLQQLVSVRNLLVTKKSESKGTALEILASVDEKLKKNQIREDLGFYLLAAYGDAYACAHGQRDYQDFERHLKMCIKCLDPDEQKRFLQERETDKIDVSDYTATRPA